MSIKHIALNFSLLSALLILTFTSCKKDEDMPLPDLGTNYFPLKTGISITYKVDSITWNDFFNPVKIDSFSFYIRLDIDTVFYDNEGRESYYWRKYYRTDSTSWVLIKNYSITKTNLRAETFEENIRYIKLVFPLKNSTTWDMNAMNTLNLTESYYSEFDMPLNIGALHFDSTATVVHQSSETLISKDEYIEIYAKNLGLINRREISITKNISGKWTNGYSYEYTILSFQTN